MIKDPGGYIPNERLFDKERNPAGNAPKGNS